VTVAALPAIALSVDVALTLLHFGHHQTGDLDWAKIREYQVREWTRAVPPDGDTKTNPCTLDQSGVGGRNDDNGDARLDQPTGGDSGLSLSLDEPRPHAAPDIREHGDIKRGEAARVESENDGGIQVHLERKSDCAECNDTEHKSAEKNVRRACEAKDGVAATVLSGRRMCYVPARDVVDSILARYLALPIQGRLLDLPCDMLRLARVRLSADRLPLLFSPALAQDIS
jgi:hypothetical protein